MNNKSKQSITIPAEVLGLSDVEIESEGSKKTMLWFKSYQSTISATHVGFDWLRKV